MAKNNARQFGLSPKDTRMVLFLLGAVLVACSYFFVFRGNITKAEELKTTNEGLQATLDELLDLERRKDATEEETRVMQEEIKTIVNQFPSELTQEKVVAIIDDMEKKTEIRVPSISMDMNMQFFPDPLLVAAEQAAAEQAAEEQAEGETPAQGEEAGSESGLQETKMPDDLITSDSLIGYVSTVTIGYTGNYSNIKKMINYINKYDDKMRIDNLNLGFDTSTGELAGTLQISMYSMYGNGKEYVAPKVKEPIELEALFSDSAVDEEGGSKKNNKKNNSEGTAE